MYIGKTSRRRLPMSRVASPCRAARAHACVLFLAVAICMATTSNATANASLDALPEDLRTELLKNHARGTQKHDGTGQPWSAEMDAWVILRHKRDGITFKNLAAEGPAVADGRNKAAINSRWTRHLQKLPGIETLLAAVKPQAVASSAAAHKAASTLPSWLYDGLVHRHASKQNAKCTDGTPWSFEEDHQILEWHLAGKQLSALQLTGRKGMATGLGPHGVPWGKLGSFDCCGPVGLSAR